MKKRPVGMFQIASLKGDTWYNIPNPDKDNFSGLVATLVNSARNVKGEVTAQKICRDQDKFTMTWSALSRSEWETLLSFWNTNFVFRLKYYSPVRGTSITRRFYVSDREYNYMDFEKSSSGKYNYNAPTGYADCKVSMVDCGRGS